MSKDKVVLRFDEVSFEYAYKKPVLDEASFSVRDGAKITLMGQNGAGKSTIFNLITSQLKPKSGRVSVDLDAVIGTAKQVIAREELDLTVEKYFEQAFEKVPHNAKGQMKDVLEAVNLLSPLDAKVRDLSGGQQARLLLAYALIQHPDILLLDEPTNNLDTAGIDHLIQFILTYDKTVIVISHDADFLNCFTEGVIYLDNFSHKIEQYVGDYYSVVEEISAQIERERRQNARMEKEIQDRKDKVNFFAHKGGKMRKLAQKLKEQVEDAEENKVEVRREDRPIVDFVIPMQEDLVGKLVVIKEVSLLKNYEPTIKKVDIALHKKMRLLVTGPNGVGKSTFLRSLISQKHEGVSITEGVKVGYYSQDFSTLNFEQTVFDSLMEVKYKDIEIQRMRGIAAGFQITGPLMEQKIANLSEGQKGLLSFARLVIMHPGLLVLDEPTNHINFRHLPIIAEALDKFEGAIILVSHMQEFINQITIDTILNLSDI